MRNYWPRNAVDRGRRQGGLRLYFTGAVRLCSGPFLLVREGRSSPAGDGLARLSAGSLLVNSQSTTLGFGLEVPLCGSPLAPGEPRITSP